jgi:hypothetical protein
MKFGKNVGVATGLAFAMAAASGGLAFAAKKSPSGNLNLRMTGYEVLAPSAGPAGQYTINGIGQVIGDTGGTLDGELTYTMVDAAAATEETCSDTITGTISAPSGSFSQSGGSFSASLTLAPSTAAGASCEGATVSLLCNRTLLHQNFVDDLDAGTYRCIGTTVAPATGGTPISAASLDVTIDSVQGANAPND